MPLSQRFYQTLPEEEQRAIDDLFAAIERLAPFGYFVGYLSPEDAMMEAPRLSCDAARAVIIENEDEWEEFLIQSAYARELMQSVLRDRGVDTSDADEPEKLDAPR